MKISEITIGLSEFKKKTNLDLNKKPEMQERAFSQPLRPVPNEFNGKKLDLNA